MGGPGSRHLTALPGGHGDQDAEAGPSPPRSEEDTERAALEDLAQTVSTWIPELAAESRLHTAFLEVQNYSARLLRRSDGELAAVFRGRSQRNPPDDEGS